MQVKISADSNRGPVRGLISFRETSVRPWDLTIFALRTAGGAPKQSSYHTWPSLVGARYECNHVYRSTAGLVWLPPSLKRVTAFLIRMNIPSRAYFMTLEATPEGLRPVSCPNFWASGPPETPLFFPSLGLASAEVSSSTGLHVFFRCSFLKPKF